MRLRVCAGEVERLDHWIVGKVRPKGAREDAVPDAEMVKYPGHLHEDVCASSWRTILPQLFSKGGRDHTNHGLGAAQVRGIVILIYDEAAVVMEDLGIRLLDLNEVRGVAEARETHIESTSRNRT